MRHLVWSVGFLVAALLGVGLGLRLWAGRSFSARDEPTRLEAFVARSLRDLAITQARPPEKNPLPFTPEVWQRARMHFADHCALCHGNDGQGRISMGRNLYPKAPDMTLAETQRLPDSHLFFIIADGVRLTGMPAWGGDTPEDIASTWELVHFVRRLSWLTAQDLGDMEARNPRSREAWAQEDASLRFLSGADGPPAGMKHPAKATPRRKP